jgi:hypothetical protein
MTTQTESAGWTGMCLTDAEKHGDLTFDIDTARLRRHGHVAAALAFGFLAFAIYSATSVNRAAPVSIADLVPAVGSLLLAAWAAIVRRWLLQRLTNAPKTAPLEFRAEIMRMGAMPFDIPYSSIEAITPQRAESLDVLMARLAYPSNSMIANPPLALYQLKLHNHPIPYVLDLDVLDGEAGKIPAILDHRIQQAKL